MRKKPYTVIGIRRKKCIRCGAQAETQWNICSDGNQFRPLCLACDIALNELVLTFIGFENKDELMEAYRKEMEDQS